MVSRNDTESYNKYINNAPDDWVWKPISENEKSEFLTLVDLAYQAMLTGDKHEKGTTLENLMTFVYQRFDEVADIHPNVGHGDNQIDHIIEFDDGMVPTFIHNYVGLRVIGESKNHNKSIGVREVADLNELLRYKRATLGIFSSFKPFSKGKRKGEIWKFAEGKRRKLALSRNVAIIGFTLDEIKQLTEKNFYTMLKEKYFNLVDEIEDDYTDYLSDDHDIPYNERLLYSLLQLKKNEIISPDIFEKAKITIIEKYGPIE